MQGNRSAPPHRRSRRSQIADLRAELIGQGATITQIADAIAERHNVTMLMAFRLASGLTRTQVADQYNRRWPSEHPRTEKYIGYWENWKGPGSPAYTGAREPSLIALRRLAQLYGCLIDDLIRPPDRVHDRTYAEIAGARRGGLPLDSG